MSKIQPIDEVMWAVIDKYGDIWATTLAHHAIDCKNDFVKDKYSTWEELEQKGYTCQQVRVQITPIDNDLNDKK